MAKKKMSKKKATKKRPVKKLVKKKAAKKSSKKKSAAKKKPTVLAPAAVTLREGQRATGFSLPSDRGETISLSQYAGKTVVIYFYPKDLTPGCTQESCDFRDAHERILARGAVVLGMSRDSVESHQKFRDTHGLPFPLLADVDGRVCEAYGVWQEKSMYGRKYMGIVRMTFVVAPDGTLKKIFPKVSVTGHVDEVLAVI